MICIKNVVLKRIKKIAGNAYKVTEIRERGFFPAFVRFTERKVFLIGILLFGFLIYLQSLFIHEIRVYGYESIPETQIREILEKYGFKEGSRKLKTAEEIDNLELAMFEELENICYIKIEYDGCLGLVTIVESVPYDSETYDKEEKNSEQNQKQDNEQNSEPCNIVADREGYIYEVLPRTGLRSVSDGAFVKPGDVLISGVIPLKSTTYGDEKSKPQFDYVHAEGTVKIKVPYKFLCYAESTERITQRTGRSIPGIEVRIGEKVFNTQHLFKGFEASECIRKKLIDFAGQNSSANQNNSIKKTKIGNKIAGKISFGVTLNHVHEIEIFERIRDEETLTKMAEAYIRIFAKENLPENAQILSKGLNFTRKENIIIMYTLLEVIEEIGAEQNIKAEQEIGLDEYKN